MDFRKKENDLRQRNLMVNHWLFIGVMSLCIHKSNCDLSIFRSAIMNISSDIDH